MVKGMQIVNRGRIRNVCKADCYLPTQNSTLIEVSLAVRTRYRDEPVEIVSPQDLCIYLYKEHFLRQTGFPARWFCCATWILRKKYSVSVFLVVIIIVNIPFVAHADVAHGQKRDVLALWLHYINGLDRMNTKMGAFKLYCKQNTCSLHT